MHINLLRKYKGEGAAVAAIGTDPDMPEQTVPKEFGENDFALNKGDHSLANTQAMEGLSERLGHLEEAQSVEIIQSLREFPEIM